MDVVVGVDHNDGFDSQLSNMTCLALWMTMSMSPPSEKGPACKSAAWVYTR